MLTRLNNLVTNTLSKGVPLLISIVLAQAVYAIMMITTIPTLTSFAQGILILDMQPFGYSTDYIQQLFSTLQAVGRNYYLTVQLPLDMVYPALFALSNSALLLYLFRKLSYKQFRFICFIPMLGGLFDYLENISIAHMLFYYPDFNPAFGVVASMFTIAKSFFTTGFFLVLIYFVIRLIIQRLTKPKHLIDIEA
ncbi:MAG: hypothetical protein OCC49_12765 [Fibrobacterales bacterium]